MSEEIKVAVAVNHFQDFYPRREIAEGAGDGKRILQPRQVFGVKAVMQDNPKESYYVEVNSIYLDMNMKDDELVSPSSIRKGMELAQEAVPLGTQVKFRVQRRKGSWPRCYFLDVID